MRSCARSSVQRLPGAVRLRGSQQRPGESHRGRAEREALRRLDAVAHAAAGDHRAPGPGAHGRADRVARPHAPVGEGGGDRTRRRVAPALDERPVRAAGTGDVDRRHAGLDELRNVGGVEAEADLLGHHGQRCQPLDDARDRLAGAGEARLALGLHRLLDRVEVTVRPSAPSSSTSAAARPGPSRAVSWTTPRLASSSGGRWAPR
jgi:hypothetical protein